jgi:hypothetical protein
MARSAWVSTLLGFASAACSWLSPGAAALVTDRERYVAGDTVELRIDNRFSELVENTLDSWVLERNVREGVWEGEMSSEGRRGERGTGPAVRVRSLRMSIVPAGERASILVRLPPDLAPGRYRFRTPVGLAGTEGRAYRDVEDGVTCEPFMVVRSRRD